MRPSAAVAKPRTKALSPTFRPTASSHVLRLVPSLPVLRIWSTTPRRSSDGGVSVHLSHPLGLYPPTAHTTPIEKRPPSGTRLPSCSTKTLKSISIQLWYSYAGPPLCSEPHKACSTFPKPWISLRGSVEIGADWTNEEAFWPSTHSLPGR